MIGQTNLLKYLTYIGLFCCFVGGLLLIPEVTIPIPNKILNWYIKRKSCSKNKNERIMTTAFDYKSEIVHKFRFWLGLRFITIGFLLQLIGAMAINKG